MTIVLLILLGVVLGVAGLALMWLSIESESGIFAFLGILAGIAFCSAAFVVPIWLGGGFDGPSDPCRHVVSVRPLIIQHYKGWITYGGRPVWCGPGPVPS